LPATTLSKACPQYTEISGQKFWRLLPETVTITSYLTSEESHDRSRVTGI
jgi:hypothetical protein